MCKIEGLQLLFIILSLGIRWILPDVSEGAVRRFLVGLGFAFVVAALVIWVTEFTKHLA
jgi:hypothetical protein